MKKFKGLIISIILLAVFGVLGWVLHIFDGFSTIVGMLQFNLYNVFQILVVITFVIIIEKLILLVLNYMQKFDGRIKTWSTLITSLVKYIAILAAVCWSLAIIGVDISTIFASIGVLALIIGFGAESLVSDLVTGIFILFENEFNVGDIIEVAGFRGKVKEIGIRTTCLEDSGNNIKIINNSDLKNILNRSNQRSVAVCDVLVGYSTDLDELEDKMPEILKKIQEDNTELFIGVVEYVGVEELGTAWMKLKFIADVDEEDIYKGKRVLNKCLKQALQAENIKLPV